MSKPTDVIGKNIYCFFGDSIEVMDQISPGSIDLVITDPPYLMEYKSNHRSNKAPEEGSREAMLQRKIQNDSGSDGRSFIRRYCQRLYRILKDDSACYMFCKMDWQDEDLLGFFKKELRSAGFKIANTIIWKKDNWTAGDLKGAFGFMYEPIIFAHKGRPIIKGLRHSDVWEFARVPDADRIHPNQKPIELLARAIEASSEPGDLIFDGCAGSGSLAVASNVLGRKTILVENDEERYPQMIDYLNKKVKDDLFSSL